MSQGSIAAGSVIVTWDYNGAKTAMASSAAIGVFSGDGTGSVNHNTGAFSFWPNVLPDPATQFRYQWIKAGTKVAAALADLGLVQEVSTITGIIPNAPLVAGQTVIAITLSPAVANVEVVADVSLRLTDNGAGRLVDSSGVDRGSIDITTGAFSISAPTSTEFRVKKYGYKRGAVEGDYRSWVWYKTVTQTVNCSLNGITNVWYLPTSSPESLDKTFELGALTFELTPESSEIIAQGSLRFNFGGRTYVDRLGYLYSNVDPATGSGEQSGTVDYVTGIVTITKWTPGSTNAKPEIQSLLTYVDEHTVSDIAFRTPGAPVRPGSIYVQCTDKDGAPHELTLPTTGVVNSGIFHGTVDHDTGVVVLQFGTMVTAADYTTAEWYDPELVDVNGKILKPIQIRADSLRYNCVTYSYLPLDKEIIKLDPVRLPTDGRVPILRKGDICVVHSTKRTPWPNGVMAGQQLNVGRTRLAKCWLEDAVGTPLAAALYSVDLDHGIVTLATPLNLTGYTQPLVAVHRVEDRAMMSDVEISGRVTLGKALSHDYDPADTYVSSALLIDDTWSRVTNVFEQKTWTSVWSGNLIGDATTAQFNSTDYPITVTNRGALTERYALVFDTSTTYRVYGEHLGLIATGSVNEVCAPSNPNHPGVPLFSINPLAFGTGWAAGNAVRFDVIGADAPFWVVRTILQSDAANDGDSFALQLRGNINKD